MVIFAAGTGKAVMRRDKAGAVRGIETDWEAVVMGKNGGEGEGGRGAGRERGEERVEGEGG